MVNRIKEFPVLKKLPSGDFRLWKGKGRICKPFLHDYNLLQWGLALKPGDYFASCCGCNRQVKEITKIHWTNTGLFHNHRKYSKNWIISEVSMTDTYGGYHSFPGGGCVLQKETPEQVREYNISFIKERLKEFENPNVVPWSKNEFSILQKQFKRIENGHPIVDDFGEFLPDWNQPYVKDQ